jgi:hypothetical protein
LYNAAGGACSTPSTGDELNEGFIGSGYENTISETGTGTIDEDFTLSGSPPTGSCTEGLNVVTNEASNYSQWNRGSAIDSSAVTFKVYLSIYVDAITLDNYAYGNFLAWTSGTDPSSNQTFALRFRNNNGTYQVQVSGENGTRTDIALDTWYEVVYYNDASTPANSYFQLTGGGSTTCDLTTDCTFTPAQTVDGQYLSFGATSGVGAGESVDVEIGYVYMDTP